MADTVWGHDNGVLEGTIKDFAFNWTGTGSVISTGDREKIGLDSDEFMVSDIVNTGGTTVAISLNNYASGNAVTVQYRTADSSAGCGTSEWTTYESSFISAGFVQLRLGNPNVGYTANFTIPAGTTTADAEDAPYSGVQPGQYVGISAGVRGQLTLQNFHGTVGNPITFFNDGGLVDIQSTAWIGLYVRNCSYIRITGSGAGAYTYGIKVSASTNNAVSLEDGSTDAEVDQIETTGVPGQGITFKTPPTSTYNETTFTQRNTKIHHCYVHDLGKEGLYIGDSSYHVLAGGYYPPLLEGMEINDNRIEQTGWDGMQVGCGVAGTNLIHHNRIIHCGTAGTASSGGNDRTGLLVQTGQSGDVYGNYIEESAEQGIYNQGNGNVRIFNNVIVRPGHGPGVAAKSHDGVGIYCSTGSNSAGSPIHVLNNTIVSSVGHGIRFNCSNGTDHTARNNLIVAAGDTTIAVETGCTLTQNNNGSVATVAAAAFRGTADRCYGLTSSSTAAINLGYNLAGSVDSDCAYVLRPQGTAYDIGAYEYEP